MNERKVSLFMVRAEKWKDLGEIRRRMNGVQILDVIATEIDGEPMILLFVAVTEAEYNHETAFVDWYLENGKGTPTYSDAIEWARKEVINKACDWLDNYLMEIGYPDDWMRDSPNIKSGEERFRKAMEE